MCDTHASRTIDMLKTSGFKPLVSLAISLHSYAHTIAAAEPTYTENKR